MVSFVSFGGSLQEELLRDKFKQEFFSKFSYSNLETTYLKGAVRQNLEALWDIAEGEELYSKEVFNKYLTSYLNGEDVSVKNQLFAAILNLKVNKVEISKQLKERLLGSLDLETVYQLLSYKNNLFPYMPYVYATIFKRYKKSVAKFYEVKKYQQLSLKNLQEIINFKPDFESFLSGKYRDSVSVYMFCRHSRQYPCLMLMKDVSGYFVEVDDKYWSQPALGLARHGVPFNIRNGYTPAGIHTMDSVMPLANKQKFFGKFRRVILNFISSDLLTKELLPKSSHSLNWWKQASIARDVGRTSLRIHGTGLRNNTRLLPYYPFVATSGCVAKREGLYDGFEYRDQRQFLDMFMESLGVDINYENEERIKGILYVIEIDDKKRAVVLKDLEQLLY
jgi:hypothetical protein